MAINLNPFGFRKWPVTIVVSAIYIAIITLGLYVHHIVPSAPKESSSSLPDGVSLNQAWIDLQQLSRQHHPYNSHNNDEVRDWILHRVNDTLRNNTVVSQQIASLESDSLFQNIGEDAKAIVFDDLSSNATYSATNPISVYFESTNIIVLLRGSGDSTMEADRHRSHSQPKQDTREQGCTLVNAHYDSVSTGFGVTDDGVGVVTLLQLLAHYTAPGNQPQRCLVLLFNNGEEDYLNGARVFSQHPVSSRVSAFLNLEGAGAGGRATMFRSTDAVVTKAYKSSPFPFGNALSADGFRQGLVRSQTDYVVFNENLGFRGVDVAFMEPRSRYHTISDSTRETSIDSVWHMLSAALATTKAMIEHEPYGPEPTTGSEPVYFDLFGRALGMLNLQMLFGISIAVLVIGPAILLLIGALLARQDKFYILAGKSFSDPLDPHTPDEPVAIDIQGRRGIFRTLITFILSIAAVVGLALLQSKVNPFIVYSSPYAIWSMIISAFIVVSWFCLSAADGTRPTAFQRLYALFWLYGFSWLLLVFCVFVEARFKICGAYISLFLNAASFLALTMSLLELFNLPRKKDYIYSASQTDSGITSHTPNPPSSRPLSSHNPPHDDSEATESSPLLGHSATAHLRHTSVSRTPFSRVFKSNDQSQENHSGIDEQPWSRHLLSLWPLQVLAFAIPIILTTQLGLFMTSALSQTLGDGSSPLTLYLAISILCTLLLLPTTPFIHRIDGRVPFFLFLILVGTLIYNLTAFIFSRENRLKVYFQERVSVDDPETNVVALTALEGYVQQIARSIPGANTTLNCSFPGMGVIKGLTTCHYATSLLPQPLPQYSNTSVVPSDWMKFTAHRLHPNNSDDDNTATLRLSGRNTRACKLHFDTPVTDFNVTGQSKQDSRFVKVPEDGLQELRLWSRDWDREWEVQIAWRDLSASSSKSSTYTSSPDRLNLGTTLTTNNSTGKGNDTSHRNKSLKGQATCLWSDANDPATIPALEELRHYMPIWSVVTKAGDGLVEGWRDFEIM
ncbi:MAG: hypothetical protein Q9159_004635 [Coniocarpon cinnabarinum]